MVGTIRAPIFSQCAEAGQVGVELVDVVLAHGRGDLAERYEHVVVVVGRDLDVFLVHNWLERHHHLFASGRLVRKTEDERRDDAKDSNC